MILILKLRYNISEKINSGLRGHLWVSKRVLDSNLKMVNELRRWIRGGDASSESLRLKNQITFNKQ